MCELLALSASHPTRVNLSLEELASHSAPAGANPDGWGTVLYEGHDARLIKEAAPAAGSAILQFMQQHDLLSTLVLSHIRHATRGALAYANTHPFCRELGGRIHSFAHNGTLRESMSLPSDVRARFRPVGETDSEEAFCVLLARLEDLWLACDDGPPSVESRLAVVAETAAEMRRSGEANFLYSDSDVLFAHGHIRRPGVGKPAVWPGLHVTLRTFGVGDDSEVSAGISVQSDVVVPDVALVASVPLTDESWTPVPEGDVLAIRRGKIVGHSAAAV